MKRVHPLTALLWVVSLVAVAWMADQLVVSLTALVALCVVAAVTGGPRRAVWRPVREICVVLVVIWALLLAGVLGHVATTGGIVVTLPSILIGSQQIGGVVHAGPTLNAANHAVQACVAVVAGAVLVQLRPAHDWLDLAMCWLGRGARVMAPGMCMAEGVSVAVADRVRLRRGGLRTSRLQALVDGIDRGREIEDRWEEARLVRSPRSWCRVLGVAGTLVVLLACVRQTMTGWTLWHGAAVDPYWDRALMTVAGLWALAGLVVLMVHGLPGVGRLRLVDVALVLAVIATVVAWLVRDRTGDAAALATPSGMPVVLCVAVVLGAVAVTVTFNAGGRRARG